MPQDFEMPVFEGNDGERWIWDPTSHTYVKAEGNGLVPSDMKPDRNHATGGDNDLFDPAQQDGNLFKPGNPLQEGILASRHTADYNGWSNYETWEANLELENDYEPYQHIMNAVQSAAAHVTQYTTTRPQAVQALAAYIANIWHQIGGPEKWAEYYAEEAEPVDPRNINWLEIAEHWLSDAESELQHHQQQDQPGTSTIPGYVQNPVYQPDQQAPGEENTMVQYASQKNPKHAEDCQCPECIEPDAGEDTREEIDHWKNPVQKHDTRPFPDRVPKPNRFKQDNSFPSSISRSNDRGNDMPNFDDFPTWDETIRREAADLDTCPDCGGPMTKSKDSADCHDCGTRQPVIYTQAHRKEAILPLIIPAVEALGEAGAAEGAAGAAAGAEGGAAGGGMGGMMDSLAGPARAAWMMNNAMGVANKTENMLGGGAGDGPIVSEESGPPESDTAQDQGKTAAVEEFLRWGLRDYHAGTFGEEETGGATKNDGHDENPAEPETKGFAEQFGDSPELLKDVNAEGGAKNPVVMEIFEMLVPKVLQPHIDAGGTGAGDPVVQWLDQLLESEFPGYRGGGDPMHVEVKDPNEPEETGEAADGPDDDSDKDKPENAPEPQQKAAYGMPGEAMPGGMGMAMGNPMMAEAPGPCQVCGMDDCVHKRGQQGNAQPNPMTTQQPNTANPQNYMASVHEAAPRRPKMCPFHSELVEYALQFGDPEKALNALSAHQFSDASCKGGHKGGCNFKPAMVKQEYWDNHAESLRERREREQMIPGQMTEVKQEIPALDPIAEETDYMPENTNTPDTTSWDDGGHVTDIGSDSAIGSPMETTANEHTAFDMGFGITDELGKFMHNPGQAVQGIENAVPGAIQQGEHMLQQAPGMAQQGLQQGLQMAQQVPGMAEQAINPMLQGQQPQIPNPFNPAFSAVEDGDEEEGECARCGHGMSKGEASCNFCNADPERSRYESKWHVADIGIQHPKHDHHDPMMQGNWTDAMGEPLTEGGDYELISPNYEIPDHVTIKSITPDALHIIIHGEMGMDYGDQITQQDMANEQYQFQPVQEVSNDPGLMQPDTDSAPMDQDNAAQVDDLGNTTASLAAMSPEAREHYLRIAAMEGTPEMGGDASRDWLMQSTGSYTDGVDPATLEKVMKLAAKDYTPREQREFIDEGGNGTARNIDRLDLDGTHYGPMDDDIESHFLF